MILSSTPGFVEPYLDEDRIHRDARSKGRGLAPWGSVGMPVFFWFPKKRGVEFATRRFGSKGVLRLWHFVDITTLSLYVYMICAKINVFIYSCTTNYKVYFEILTPSYCYRSNVWTPPFT